MIARVFVEFPKLNAVPSPDVIACDVGVNIGVARSDGYKSKSLRPVMNRARQKRAEQQRQGHQKSSTRSAVKQLLDREARKAVTLAARTGKTLVLEAQKPLSNLKPSGSIGGWPCAHFAARCRQIAEEIGGVFVWEQWPARSSMTCTACGHCDKTNRTGERFHCVSCGFTRHADILASINLARWARGGISRYPAKAAKKHDSLHCVPKLPLGGVGKS
jgi:transposase